MQPEYLMECLLLLHQAGIHTAVETAACVEWSRIERALPFLDLFICDLKSMDEEALYEATGGNLSLILENIRKVSETQIPFWVRTPVIPGFNDTTENMEKMAEFLENLPRKPFVELLPFHNLSVGKYASLGQTYAAADMKPPEKEQMRRLNEILKAHQIEVKEI